MLFRISIFEKMDLLKVVVGNDLSKFDGVILSLEKQIVELNDFEKCENIQKLIEEMTEYIVNNKINDQAEYLLKIDVLMKKLSVRKFKMERLKKIEILEYRMKTYYSNSILLLSNLQIKLLLNNYTQANKLINEFELEYFSDEIDEFKAEISYQPNFSKIAEMKTQFKMLYDSVVDKESTKDLIKSIQTIFTDLDRLGTC